ncbi:hypothetical protein BLA60_30840 [Actinophytocola xinjiangensis]|uniref:Leucine-binding protein domain-containing protein n=2 Tax=Actinophytocola xinjiangensis TaxID=485602 RepID=A0A7Z0WI33_9PSEU|nr:hypothetical protein BLA60_30840 [Actinophytocola xinjiangensis]
MRLAAAAAAVLVVGAGCGEPADQGASDTLRIDALAALSGPSAAVGQAMSQGMKAAVAVINDGGGVFGKPVELNLIDYGSGPTQAVAKAQELVSQGTPQAAIPGTPGSDIAAAMPVFAKAGVFVSHHDTNPDLTDVAKYPLSFTNAYPVDNATASLAERLAGEGYRSIAYLTADDTSSRSNARSAQAAFEEAGMSTEVGYVPTTAVDGTPQLQQLLASEPDALVLRAYGAQAPPIIKARQKLNPDLPTYGTQDLTASNLDDLAPASAYAGMTFQSISLAVEGSPATQTPAFTTFYEALKAETGGELPFTIFTYLVGYNDVMLAAAAAEKAGNTDPKEMAAAVESITAEDMPNYVGPVSFSPDQHYPEYDSEWWTYISYGPKVDGLIQPQS